MELHAPGPAHRHCMAALRNTNYYELGLVHPKVKGTGPPSTPATTRTPWTPSTARGTSPVPQGPGLGVTIDWDYVRRHEAGKTVYE